MKKIPAIILVFVIVSAFFSCEVIYNYDLSLSGLDTLPATKACIQKYIPKSIDAHKGRQYSEIKALALILDTCENEIIDSLISDSVSLDEGYNLSFIIIGLDPFDEITEVEIKKIYFPNSE